MLLLPDRIRAHREEMIVALREERIDDAIAESHHLSTGRVAQILASAEPGLPSAFLLAIEASRAGDILGQMSTPVAADILEGLEPDDAVGLFREIRPEYAADIYHLWSRVDPERAESVVGALEEGHAAKVRELGQYPPGTVGAAMVIRYLAVEQGATVGDTVLAIRSAPPEVERSAYVYVVDGAGALEGVVSVRDLLLADPELRVDELANRQTVAVATGDDALSAARLLRNRAFKLLPVVDADGRLVGVLTREDAFDLLAAEIAGGFVRSAQGSVDESFFTPPMAAVRGRLPWMGLNVFLNLGAVVVISSFESTIAQVAILAAFLPMITDMGGNVGIQALSVAIRSLALDEVRIGDFWRAVRKEVLIGLVNGATLGLLFAVMATVLEANAWLGLVAGFALAVNVLLAGVVGGALPFIIKRLGKDPAMMTGPFLTTITDITGVSIYLGLSTIFLTQIVG